MVGDALEFPTVAVCQHASSVDGIAAGVDQADTAVGEMTMDTQAYGSLCRFLPGLLSPIVELAASALSGSADALHVTAANLRSAADRTASTDRAGARRITAAGPPGQPTIELPL